MASSLTMLESNQAVSIIPYETVPYHTGTDTEYRPKKEGPLEKERKERERETALQLWWQSVESVVVVFSILFYFFFEF